MSGRRRLDLIAIALAVLLSTLLPAGAGASDGVNLTGLRVEGGNVWHSENSFLVEWDPNPPGTEPVQYAIRAANLNLIRGYPDQWTRESFVGAIHVPPIPGVYYFEARTWRGPYAVGDDTFGPPVYVPLYFDDVQPTPVTVAAPPSIAAGEAITAQVTPPPAPLPVSGISGYAVTFDSQPDASPCARHCPASAVNIAGAGAGQVRFPAAPEGIGYVHAVAVSGSGMASRAVSTTPVVIDGSPPAVHLEGAPSGDWSAVPVRVTAVAVDRLSGMDAAGPTGPVTALAVDGAPAHLVPGSSATAMVSGDGIHQLQFYGRDAVGNSGDGSLPFAHPGTATVRIDESGPDVRLAAPDPTDPERIEATVADPLSGPDPDRGLIEFRRVGSSSRFQPLPTESHRGRLVARWPSDDFARGPYEFRATGYDAVGNATTSSLGGGGRLVLQNPVKREARLAFGFGAASLVFQRCTRADGSRTCHREVVRPFAQRPAARTLPCCHGAVVGGRLVDAAGEPLAGETVEVVEDFESGARNAERRTELSTDVDGRFSTRLVPGPSRAVTAEFAGTRRLTRVGGRRLRLRVRAAVHLRVSTARVAVGGAPVVFSGRIDHPEAPIPAVGLPVQLEFRLPGMPWTEFRTVQSNALGRFRYPYSFSDDDSDGVRFLFRAAVPATGGWPFASATSRPLAVTG